MEIWKDIKGWEGLYQVSNLGRVKSLDRYVNNGYCDYLIKGKIKKPTIANTGYCFVGLANSIEKTYTIHRLVAIAFLPNPENKRTINHINGDKTDNRVENLEWNTHSENHKHAYRVGIKCNKGENSPRSKITEVQAKKIKYDFINVLNSELSQIYGVTTQTISDIKKGKSWKHI